MKWLAAALAGFVLVAWLVLNQAPHAATPVSSAPATSPVPAARAVAPAPVDAQVAAPVPSGIALRGVLLQPSHPDDSLALLSVAGAPAQPLRTGDAIDAQWRLESIAADHVIVMSAGNKARLDVVTDAAPASSATATAPKASQAELVLPGFTKGAAQDNAAALANAHEQNRRFIEARQKRGGG